MLDDPLRTCREVPCEDGSDLLSEGDDARLPVGSLSLHMYDVQGPGLGIQVSDLGEADLLVPCACVETQEHEGVCPDPQKY